MRILAGEVGSISAQPQSNAFITILLVCHTIILRRAAQQCDRAEVDHGELKRALLALASSVQSRYPALGWFSYSAFQSLFTSILMFPKLKYYSDIFELYFEYIRQRCAWVLGSYLLSPYCSVFQ